MKSYYDQAVRFFTETKDEKQLELAYKEIENFMESFINFEFYYNLSTLKIDPKVFNQLSTEEKSYK